MHNFKSSIYDKQHFHLYLSVMLNISMPVLYHCVRPCEGTCVCVLLFTPNVHLFLYGTSPHCNGCSRV